MGKRRRLNEELDHLQRTIFELSVCGAPLVRVSLRELGAVVRFGGPFDESLGGTARMRVFEVEHSSCDHGKSPARAPAP